MTSPIRFLIADSSLGFLLVASSGRGLCHIALDDKPGVLTDALRQHFPAAQAAADDADLQQALGNVITRLENPYADVDLPLDSQGTAFQQHVWQALRTIPAGTTLSYSQLAERIGKPKAVRAVASACAANKLAVVIPCHRVVGKNGTLSGYRWGIERKAELLRREKQHKPDLSGF